MVQGQKDIRKHIADRTMENLKQMLHMSTLPPYFLPGKPSLALDVACPKSDAARRMALSLISYDTVVGSAVRGIVAALKTMVLTAGMIT